MTSAISSAVDAPSETARFYLWATALAKGIGAPGENQFNTAQALHRMWDQNQNELTRTQALRAYRSYLDNYRNSVTFFEIPVDSDQFFPFSLDRFTGEMLFDPTNVSNQAGTAGQLFAADPGANQLLASEEVGMWGYFYDTDTRIFTPF